MKTCQVTRSAPSKGDTLVTGPMDYLGWVLWVLMWVQHLGKFTDFEVQRHHLLFGQPLSHQLLEEGLHPVTGAWQSCLILMLFGGIR